MLRLFSCGVLLLAASACYHPENDIPQANVDINLDISASKSFGSPLLSSYNSCEQLNAALKKTALDEMHTRFAIHAKRGPRYWSNNDKAVSAGAMPEAVVSDSPTAPVEGVDFSGTNNQEKGIDEADIVKTDGKFFYALNKSTLSVIGMPKVGELKEAAIANLASPGAGILLSGDQAFVVANESGFNNDTIRLDTIDLGVDRKDVHVSDSNYFEGELIAARKIGSKIYLATYQDTRIPGLINYPELGNIAYSSEPERNAAWQEAIHRTVAQNEETINNFDFLSLVPKQLSRRSSKFEANTIEARDCSQTFGAENSSASGFLSLISLDEKGKFDIERVRGNRPIVYASDKQFILASPEHESWWFFNNEELKDQTTIHRFDLDSSGIPRYHDSLRVPGTLHNSFSLSEHNSYLRVATTTSPQSRFWLSDTNTLENRPVDENHLFVLGDNNGKLDVVGSIEGLAKGEKIWSARFSDDLGFLVTFKQVDPLFTLDLKNPKEPKVAGELKIPGVSTYLQEIDQNHLLAVGYGGNEKGTDFQTTVSLFDVSDLSNPKLADSLEFSLENGLNSWSRVSSEANQNHLAVNYFSPVAMTAIPLETNRYVENPLDPVGGQFEYVSKLTLVDTKVGEELKIHGEVDHSKYYNKTPSDYRQMPSIRRSYFVGDYIYAISSKAITATKLSDMSTTGEYEFR